MSQEGKFKMTPKDFEWFDCPKAFVDEVLKQRGGPAGIDHRESWAGETRDELIERSRNGYTGAVPKAEAMLNDIDCQLDAKGLTPSWGRSVVGPFPDVPAFLGGSPECMYSRDYVKRQGPQTELNVYYCPMTSAIVDEKESAKRGTVMLAAVLALSRVRPVNAFYVTCMGKNEHIIKLRTNPMVLSESAYVLTSTAFYRSLSFTYGHIAGWKGGWGAWSCIGGAKGQTLTPDERVEHMKTCLGLSDDDVFVPGVHAGNMGVFRDPVKWINGLLDRYRA